MRGHVLNISCGGILIGNPQYLTSVLFYMVKLSETTVLGRPFTVRCLSVTLVHCGQTVGWIKMPLGTEVGLGLRDIVLDGDPAPLA